MLERLLARAAPRRRAGRSRHEVAPGDPHHLLDEIVHPTLGWLKSALRLASPASTSRAERASRSRRSRSCSPAKGRGRISARTEEAVRAAATELGYRPERGRARAAHRRRAQRRARRPRHHQPVLRARAARRAARGAARRLHRRARRHRQRPRVGDRIAAGAARRPRRRAAAVRGRAAAGRDRARDRDRDAARRAAGRPARRRGRRRLRARPPARARPPRGSRHVAVELRRADVRPAPRARSSPGWAAGRPHRARAPFTFEGAAAAAGAAAGRGGVTAVFCDDDILAGGVYLAARERGVSNPRGPLASSASTTSTSRASLARR